MSANVETMSYFGEVPWHRFGTPMSEADQYDLDGTLVKSGLDWEAEKIGLQTVDTLQPVTSFAVRRKTDGKILGVVGERYTVLQNRNAFEWFRPFVEAREALFHTAGALAEGSRVWILAKLNRDPMEIVKNDLVDKYLLLSHSHDGTLAVRVGFTPIRVVCANTLAMAHGNAASKLIRIKHTATVQDNLDAIRDTINIANEAFEATAEQYRRLASKDINQNDVVKYIKQVMGMDTEEKLSTRSVNIIESVMKYVETGRGNDVPGVRGTLWAAYNGVTEYLAYGRGHTPESRMNSLWYGASANSNKDALELALALAV